jgi:glycosyltransferase involved in cell wall biosynthesis
MTRIAAIIPAYNEARRIEQVLRPLHQTDFLSKIIVVDDGSLDNTAHIVEALAGIDNRIQVVVHTHNEGKGGAVRTGLRLCRADHEAVLMLDADLFGMQTEHNQDVKIFAFFTCKHAANTRILTESVFQRYNQRR